MSTRDTYGLTIIDAGRPGDAPCIIRLRRLLKYARRAMLLHVTDIREIAASWGRGRSPAGGGAKRRTPPDWPAAT